MSNILPTTIVIAFSALGLAGLFGTFIYSPFRRASAFDRLVERYGTERVPTGQPLKRQTIKLGPVRWRRCTLLSIEPDGLYIQLRPPGTQYAPILVPWTDLHYVRNTPIYWQNAAELTVGTPAITHLVLMQRHWRLIEPHLLPRESH